MSSKKSRKKKKIPFKRYPSRKPRKNIGREIDRLLTKRYANAVLRRLANLRPDNAYVQHTLAVSYFLMGDLPEGIRHCRRTLKLKPDYPLALYNLALAHHKAGQADRARRYAARALTLSPSDEQIRALAGELGVVGFWQNLKNKLFRPRRRPRRWQDSW